MEENENKKKSKILPIVVVIVIIALLAILGGLYYTNQQKPKNIFMHALNLEENKEKDVKTVNADLALDVNINSEDESIKQVADYLNKTKLSANIQLDLEQKKGIVKLGADYENEKLIDAKATYKVGEDNAYAYVEGLFDKYFAIPVDEETRNSLNTSIEEAGKSLVEDKAKTEKAYKIFTETLSKNLKDEYFSQEKAEVDVNGTKVNTKKSILTLTAKDLKEVVKNVSKELKDNEEFLNCFKDESKTELKNELEELINTLEDESNTEEGTFIMSIYTKGFNAELVKVEIVLTDKVNTYNLSILKTEKDTYRVTVSVPEEGEVTANVKVSYKVNEAIENLDTQNNINVENMSNEDMMKIYGNLQNMKIYKLISEIIGSNIIF